MASVVTVTLGAMTFLSALAWSCVSSAEDGSGAEPQKASATPVTSPAAPATPAEGPRHADDARTLRGHTFPRPVSEDSAFIPTTIGFRQGLLYTNAGTLPLLGSERSVVRVAAIESIDTSINVVDWFSVGATGDLQALLAASDGALVSTTSYVAGGLRMGPAFRALRIRSTGTQITLRPYFQATFGALVDVASVLTRLEERTNIEAQSPPATVEESVARARRLQNQFLQSAVTPLARRAWGGSVHVANTLTPQLGVQLSYGLKRERFVASAFDLNRGRLPDEYFVSLTHVATGTLSFDAVSLGVPLALMGEIVIAGGNLGAEATGASVALDTTVLTGVGLYYSGRRTLQVGVHAATESGLSPIVTPFGKTAAPQAYYGQFSLRYFFEAGS